MAYHPQRVNLVPVNEAGEWSVQDTRKVMNAIVSQPLVWNTGLGNVASAPTDEPRLPWTPSLPARVQWNKHHTWDVDGVDDRPNVVSWRLDDRPVLGVTIQWPQELNLLQRVRCRDKTTGLVASWDVVHDGPADLEVKTQTKTCVEITRSCCGPLWACWTAHPTLPWVSKVLWGRGPKPRADNAAFIEGGTVARRQMEAMRAKGTSRDSLLAIYMSRWSRLMGQPFPSSRARTLTVPHLVDLLWGPAGWHAPTVHPTTVPVDGSAWPPLGGGEETGGAGGSGVAPSARVGTHPPETPGAR